MIADLRKLWQEAFEDSDSALDGFFATGFSPDRFHSLQENGAPVCANYWFDCEVDGQKMAYLYAIATLKSHRGKGLAKKLIAETQEILKARGYAGAILVPGEPSLFDFYEKIGYRTATTVTEISATAGDAPVALHKIDPAEYGALRKTLLPPGSVVQEGATLDYLNTYCALFAGADFVLAAAMDEGALLVQEYLGDAALIPGILAALGAKKGQFRTPGTDRNFAMYLPLTPDCPRPGYFGLALD